MSDPEKIDFKAVGVPEGSPIKVLAEDLSKRISDLRIHATYGGVDDPAVKLVSKWMRTQAAILYVNRSSGVMAVYKPDDMFPIEV